MGTEKDEMELIGRVALGGSGTHALVGSCMSFSLICLHQSAAYEAK